MGVGDAFLHVCGGLRPGAPRRAPTARPILLQPLGRELSVILLYFPLQNPEVPFAPKEVVMSEQQATQRRTPSPRVVAYRTERRSVLGMRDDIGELQKRVAFVEARARSTRSDADAVMTEIETIKTAIASSSARLDELMRGEVGVGPAEDCRKALMHLSRRLSNLPN